MRLLLISIVLGTLAVANAQHSCVLDDFSTLLEDARADGTISSEVGPCPDRAAERSYLTVGQGVFTPFSAIDNDFSESFCIGFLVNTSLTNTAPLAYFHDGSDLGILGNITVEAGTPGSITLSIKGAEIVFDMDIEEDFERFQLCYDSEENEMTLYDGCSAVEGSLNFPEFSFEDTDSLGLLRDLASSQPAFQNSVTQFYFLSCTGPGVTQEGMAQVQCDSSPIDCDDPFVPLETAVQQCVDPLDAVIPTPTISISTTQISTTQISTTVIANVTSGECCECARGSNEVPGKRENDCGCISTIIGVSAASLLMTVTLTIIIITQCLLMVRRRKSK